MAIAANNFTGVCFDNQGKLPVIMIAGKSASMWQWM